MLKKFKHHMIIERQLTIFDINTTLRGGQEWPPKNDGVLRILLNFKDHKIYRYIQITYLNGTSSTTNTRYFTEQSTNCKEMIVCLIFPKSNFSHKERGIKLTLNPKSHKARSIDTFLIRKEIEIPGSLSLEGSLSWIVALNSSVYVAVSCSFNFLLLDKISFKNSE